MPEAPARSARAAEDAGRVATKPRSCAALSAARTGAPGRIASSVLAQNVRPTTAASCNARLASAPSASRRAASSARTLGGSAAGGAPSYDVARELLEEERVALGVRGDALGAAGGVAQQVAGERGGVARRERAELQRRATPGAARRARAAR